ncbi:MAG: macro domain-containing protein [Candidatus Kapabacteria bacterium]|jgi:O-acetyl-ADP-ribose deacetylase (regulator of RNase III)|nr:macro domain-containing protein [Candidatus Kapabacteria bacterium]
MTFTQGNILEIHAEALVNTVNLQGVMGKGIALAFKKQFPKNFKLYKAAAEAGELAMGKMFVTETDELTPHYIINFPTKDHWRYPSKLSYIEEGLQDLVRIIREKNIRSIVVPPLGCGNGKLRWSDVHPLIEQYLSPLAAECTITVLEPGFEAVREEVAELVPLTPARAMLVYVLHRYRVLGYDINLLVAQKTAYFLQRFGEHLRLNFEKGMYGPFAANLNKVLQLLNGSFLHYNETRNNPDTEITIIEPNLSIVEEYVANNLQPEQRERMQQVLDFIEGFESPYGLELLATVDFALLEQPDYSLNDVQEHIANWTERKREIMKPAHIQIAYRHIRESQLNTVTA